MKIEKNQKKMPAYRGVIESLQNVKQIIPLLLKKRTSFQESIQKSQVNFIETDSKNNKYIFGVNKDGDDYFRKIYFSNIKKQEYKALEGVKGVHIYMDKVYATHKINNEIYISVFHENQNEWEEIDKINFEKNDKNRTRSLPCNIFINKKGRFEKQNNSSRYGGEIHADYAYLYYWDDNQWNIFGKRESDGSYRISKIPEDYNVFFNGANVKIGNLISHENITSLVYYPVSIKPLQENIAKISEEPLRYKISLSDYNIRFSKAISTESADINVEYDSLTITMKREKIPENITLIVDSYGITCKLNLENWIL